MTTAEMISLCQTCLDFDSPMITTLSEEAGISRAAASAWIGQHLDAIFGRKGGAL